VLLALAAGLAWLVRLPQFTLRAISVGGDVAHTNVATLRANVVSRLHGGFFTLDLAQAKAAFEALPWVRHVVVRREFPNRLSVQLQEHQAVALWGPEEGERLVNSFGEVFEANLGEVTQDNLPRLYGPQARSAEVLAMWQLLNPVLAPLDLALDVLELTPGGSWHAELDNGAVVELGRGEPAQLLARLQTARKTLTQATAAYRRNPQQLLALDLRHSDGYAMRLEGVSTLEPKVKKN
jgi:cell division protein FtsQ